MRVHLISGATSGIGRAYYDLVIRKGETAIPMVRSAEAARRLGAERYLQCDFCIPQQVERACRDFDQTIDVFVNCAGIMTSKSLMESSIEDMTEIVNVNLLSAMAAVARLEPKIRDGGVVILYGSQSGFKGSWDDGYAITKDAIHAMVRTLSLKFAPNKRILAIAPGIADRTRMTDRRSEEDLAAARARIPMQQFCDPQDLAEITYFLTLDPCKAMSGCTIDVNGANHLR